MENGKSFRYTTQELQQLLIELNLGVPISEVQQKNGRPIAGIADKLERLSLQAPAIWNPEKIKEYLKGHRKKKSKESWHRYREKRKDRSKRIILNYLTQHPTATVGDLRSASLGLDLSIGYHDRINDARREAGLKQRKYTKLSKKERKQRLLGYLRENTEASCNDIVEAGLRTDFKAIYNFNLTDARRDAGIIKPGYVLAAEAARLWGVSRQYVSKMYKQCKIDGYKVGINLFIAL